jgi:hypothetical protein
LARKAYRIYGRAATARRQAARAQPLGAAQIFPNPGATPLERIDRYALRDAAWALKKSERLSGSDSVDEALVLSEKVIINIKTFADGIGRRNRL